MKDLSKLTSKYIETTQKIKSLQEQQQACVREIIDLMKNRHVEVIKTTGGEIKLRQHTSYRFDSKEIESLTERIEELKKEMKAKGECSEKYTEFIQFLPYQ